MKKDGCLTKVESEAIGWSIQDVESKWKSSSDETIKKILKIEIEKTSLQVFFKTISIILTIWNEFPRIPKKFTVEDSAESPGIFLNCLKLIQEIHQIGN